MLQLTHRAMACDFVVLIRDQEQRIGNKPVADFVLDALESVDAIEDRLSIYRASSEFSLINRNAGKRPTVVSRETFRLIAEATELSELTQGAFDLTAGPLVEAWGFTRRQGSKPTPEQIAAALAKTGYRQIHLDAEQQSVYLPDADMRINPGAIGKGDAIDYLAERLRQSGIADFLIHAGQSSVFAAGNQFEPAVSAGEDADDASPRGWLVGLSHPTKPNRRLAGFWLQDEAMATSGSGKQFFHHRGRRFGHVIDPRTGYPAGELLSLTLRHPRASVADALATGLFVMSTDERQNWLSETAAKAFEVAPAMLSVAPTSRQDEVTIQACGRWVWQESPED